MFLIIGIGIVWLLTIAAIMTGTNPLALMSTAATAVRHSPDARRARLAVEAQERRALEAEQDEATAKAARRARIEFDHTIRKAEQEAGVGGSDSTLELTRCEDKDCSTCWSDIIPKGRTRRKKSISAGQSSATSTTLTTENTNDFAVDEVSGAGVCSNCGGYAYHGSPCPSMDGRTLNEDFKYVNECLTRNSYDYAKGNIGLGMFNSRQEALVGMLKQKGYNVHEIHGPEGLVMVFPSR